MRFVLQHVKLQETQMAAPVPFTREDIASYEAARVPDTSTPAAETPEQDQPVEQAPEDTTSVDSEAEPTESAEDGSSVENAEATADGDSDAETEIEGETPATPRKPIPYTRFQEVVDEKNALREYGKLREQEAAELRAKLAERDATPTVSTESTPEEDAPPTLEQFDYDPVAHSEAQSKWVAKQVKKEVEKNLAAERVQQSVAKARADFNARAEAFAKDNPGFQKAVANPNLPKLTEKAARRILTSENGPAVLNHLATNLGEAARIAKLPVDEQMLELGMIEGRVTQSTAKPATPPAKTRTVTKAPPPPKPVPSGSSQKTNNPLDPNQDMNTWVANERNRKLAERESKMKLRHALARR